MVRYFRANVVLIPWSMLRLDVSRDLPPAQGDQGDVCVLTADRPTGRIYNSREGGMIRLLDQAYRERM